MDAKTDDTRIDKWVAQYIALRDWKREQEAVFKQFMAKNTALMEKLEGEMLAFLDRTGQQMARTADGTVYTTVRHTAPLTDPDAFMDFVIDHGLWELIERRANSTACREYAEANGILPPGVKINSKRDVGVRTS